MHKQSFLLLCLIFLIFMVWGCGTAPAPTPDPREVLSWNGKIVTTTESFASKIIYCTGNISIENGATLTLTYVTLYMSCESHGQHGIFINPGGTLNIKTNSIITRSATTEKNYAFWYKSGSSGEVTSSTVLYTYTPSTDSKALVTGEAGMFIETGGLTITNSTVSNSTGNGIEVYRGHGFSASGSTFSSNSGNGILIRNSNGVRIYNCTISSNGTNAGLTDGSGLVVMTSQGTVDSNTISSNRLIGLYVTGTKEVDVYRNTISSNNVGLKIFNYSSTGSFEYNSITNNTTHGIHVNNTSPIFYYNTVTGNSKGVYIQNNYGTTIPNFGDTTISRTGYNNLSSNTYGIYNSTTQSLKAENNYWALFSVGAIQNYNQDWSNYIDPYPWLISAP
ncbi:MAG: right-handed parallel beta-helix repeat-containing protein [Candidatus Saganbacteria bacterium]|nr:right-handed parallel beta-helix repeat-containing protein [Candidatus Saganbacteria bacterium]